MENKRKENDEKRIFYYLVEQKYKRKEKNLILNYNFALDLIKQQPSFFCYCLMTQGGQLSKYKFSAQFLLKCDEKSLCSGVQKIFLFNFSPSLFFHSSKHTYFFFLPTSFLFFSFLPISIQVNKGLSQELAPKWTTYLLVQYLCYVQIMGPSYNYGILLGRDYCV